MSDMPRVGPSDPSAVSNGTSALGGPGIDPTDDPRKHLQLKRLRRLWNDCLAVMGLEAMLLIAWSTFQEHRFALGLDFSIYNQGAWLIAHGQLNPWSSIDNYLFVRDHFTLLMWPIAAI
ncbi:MAG: hypothetical protein ABSF84_01405 [Acidimicrobiales bacterium]|jgi:hypothetical protein